MAANKPGINAVMPRTISIALLSVAIIASAASDPLFLAHAQTPRVSEVNSPQNRRPTPAAKPTPRATPKPPAATTNNEDKSAPLLWKTFLKRLDGAPAVDTSVSATSGDKTTIYVGSDGALVCLDGGGRTQWATVIGATQAQPTFDAVRVYMGTDRGVFYALNRDTGRIAWKYAAPTTILSTPAVLPGGKQVVFECSDGNIYALNAATGTFVWSFKRNDGSLGYSSPTVDKQSVFVCGENTVYKLAADTGKEQWRTPIGGKSLGTPVIDGDKVFVGGDGSSLMALDAQNGKPLWTFSGGPTPKGATGEWFGPPLAAGGTVYVSTYNRWVYAVDAQTGRAKWTYRVLGSALTRPALDAKRGVLYVASTTFRDNPTVTALNAQTGAKLWDYKAGYVSASPIVAGERVYVASTNGFLHTFSTR